MRIELRYNVKKGQRTSENPLKQIEFMVYLVIYNK